MVAVAALPRSVRPGHCLAAALLVAVLKVAMSPRAEAPTETAAGRRRAIRDPVVRASALHGCWAHALLDNMPRLFEAAEELRGRRWVLLFERADFDAHQEGRDLVDAVAGRYWGAWGDLVDALGAAEVLFEHLLEDGERGGSGLPVFRGEVVNVSYHSRLSVWDGDDVYPGRPDRTLGERIPFERRVVSYRTMVRRVLDAHLPDHASIRPGRALVVDREGGDRRFRPDVLAGLLHVLGGVGALEFGGLQSFERLRLAEQLAMVRSTRLFVLRHGAAEAWAAFLPPGSVLFEVNTAQEVADRRSIMYGQVCRISGCQHVNADEASAVERLCSVMNWTSHSLCSNPTQFWFENGRERPGRMRSEVEYT